MSQEVKHLTLEERQVIEKGIYAGKTKAEIARSLNKNKTCIGKEIKKHLILRPAGYPCNCATFASCPNKKSCAGTKCPSFVPFSCQRRDKSPGACNGCSKYNSCHYEKRVYRAYTANTEYRETLVASREGIIVHIDSCPVCQRTGEHILTLDCFELPGFVIEKL